MDSTSHRSTARRAIAALVAASLVTGCGADLTTDTSAPASIPLVTESSVPINDDLEEVRTMNDVERLAQALPGSVVTQPENSDGADESMPTHQLILLQREDVSAFLEAITQAPELVGFVTEDGEEIRSVAARLIDPDSPESAGVLDSNGDFVGNEDEAPLTSELWHVPTMQIMGLSLFVEGGLFGEYTTVTDPDGRVFGFTPLLPAAALPDDPASISEEFLRYSLHLPEPVLTEAIAEFGTIGDDELLVVISIS